MATKLPAFEDLDDNYSSLPDPQRIIREINPKYADNDEIKNTCVLRISQALNACPGHEIPKLDYLYTIVGTNGKRYALRVKEMKQYMTARYGAPLVLNATAKGVIDNTPIIKQRGIIAFDVAGWDDASGHFTLWDGEQLE